MTALEEVAALDRESVAISVVLPTHNEVELVVSTVLNIVAGLSARRLAFEVVLVENGSTDGTLQLVRLLSAQVGQLRIVVLEDPDYGAALAAGFAAARAPVIVSFDVDYYDLAFLDAAIPSVKSGDAAIVLGSKRAPGARDLRPLPRRLLTGLFSNLVHALLGLEVRDAHGMKAIDKIVVGPLVQRCVMRGSLFDVEMVLRASRLGLKLVEIPTTVIERRSPRTSVARRSLEGLFGIFQLFYVLRDEQADNASRVSRTARHLTVRALGGLRASLALKTRSAPQSPVPVPHGAGPTAQ